jgi:hypothetical protein
VSLRLSAFLTVFSLPLVVPGRVFAQDAAPVDVTAQAHETAITNFEAGRRMLEQGNCKDALPRFRASIIAEPNVGARFNLAECSKSEGKVADAWNHFKAAEQLARVKNDTDRADAAHDAAAALEPSVCKFRLVLSFAGATPQVRVSIDQSEVLPADLAMLGTGYALAPTVRHDVRVAATGYEPWSGSVEGAAGLELQPLVVEPKALPVVVPVTPPRQTVPEGSSSLRLAGFATAGVGAAGLVLGTVFGVIALGKKSGYDDAVQDPANGCGATRQTCNANVRDKRDAIDTPAAVSTVGFVVGAVAAVAGVTMIVLSKGPTTNGVAAKPTTVVLAPGSALVQGAF